MSLPSGCIEEAGLVEAVYQASDGMVFTDLNGKILYVNAAFTTLTGYTSEEVVGQNPRLLKSGRHHRAVYEELWRNIVSGACWRGEVINRRKDGSLYLEEMRISPVRDSCGKISGFLAIKRDVTERRAREDARALLAAIVENSQDAIVACTPAGMVRSWNHGAENLLGFTSDESLGQHASAFVPSERQWHLAEGIEKLSRGDSISQYEGVLLHKDGRTRCVCRRHTHPKQCWGSGGDCSHGPGHYQSQAYRRGLAAFGGGVPHALQQRQRRDLHCQP